MPTMMGNQGTSRSGLRKAAAIIKSGGLGTVKEVHVFTNRPVWKQGGERPATEPVPRECTGICGSAPHPNVTMPKDITRSHGGAGGISVPAP